MQFVEYGKENINTIMMIHGGGLSWWNYKAEAEMLKGSYHVILPIIEGHGDNDNPFISIEDSATNLVKYIDEHFGGRVKAICGLSLGAQILVEMLAQKSDICEYAVVESVLLKPSKMMERLIGPSFSLSYGLIKQMWFSKLQFKSMHINDSLFDDYYRDTCLIKKGNMISFMKSNQSYFLKDNVKNTPAKVKIIVGQKEQKSMIESAKLLKTRINDSELEIKEGLYHGEFSLNNPEQFVEELRELMGVDRTIC